MLKFDTLNRHETADLGVWRRWAKSPCAVCTEPTHFMDIRLATPVCSPRCQQDLTRPAETFDLGGEA